MLVIMELECIYFKTPPKMVYDCSFIARGIVKRLNAKVKLLEVWKALNVPKYPLQVSRKQSSDDQMNTRACTNGRLMEEKVSKVMSSSCVGDALKIWNHAHDNLKNILTINSMKNAVTEYVKTLPI